jgi:integrase
VLVWFLAYTGLRFGEAVALRVKRLDLLRGRCEVVESATEVGSALVWGPTKTDERRTVRLPRFLAELLGEHLAGRPADPDALVFTAPLGGPLRERKFLHDQLKPAARRAGLPDALRAHDLRHTAASLLIRQGASVKAVQKTLGHKSAVMTLDRYGHLWPDELKDLAERLDRALAAAVAPEAWPQRGPNVAPLRKRRGQ